MKSFKYLNISLIAFILPIVIWSIVLVFLEKKPSFYIQTKDFYYFYRLDLTSLFFDSSVKSTPKHITNTINNIKLKAIYKNGKKSFIIVDIRGKSKFLYLNDVINGYKLKEIKTNEAIFEKNSKLYVLKFKNIKSKINYQTSNKISISKNTFNEYAHNLSKIWKNIGIVKAREGYKVTYVRKNSIFDKIGLKRGDILIEVNGKKLNSDKDAWELYKNMNKYSFYEITLKRNNQIKVINYEIN